MPFMPRLSNSIEPFSNKLPNARIEIETYEGKSGFFLCVCVCLQCVKRNSYFNDGFLSVIIVGPVGSGD